MYQAKDAGRNNFKYFTAGMNEAMFARMELEQRLRRAVAQNEFALHYQPIVDMQLESSAASKPLSAGKTLTLA